MKYKVGDKVRIKSIDWYSENKDTDGCVHCGDRFFDNYMSVFCGSVVTIGGIGLYGYSIQEDMQCRTWTDKMIEGLVEEEINQESDLIDKNMEQIKKYIRGNSKRGHEVIVELEKLGGRNTLNFQGDAFYSIYFISSDKVIHWDYENSFTAQLILTNPEWREIELPKKDKYPKSFIDCCKILYPYYNLETISQRVNGYKGDLLTRFQKLLICRDAYCKIAGEEMGLGKLWERCDTKNKYIIRRVGDEILKSNNISCVLSFPTPEMRDAFYDNFIELIEECKELL